MGYSKGAAKRRLRMGFAECAEAMLANPDSVEYPSHACFDRKSVVSLQLWELSKEGTEADLEEFDEAFTEFEN